MRIKKCENCNKEFQVKDSHFDRRKNCSAKCYYKSKKGKPNFKNRNSVIMVCKTCGVEYKVVKARENITNYCSFDCKHIGQSEAIKGDKNGNWHNGSSETKYASGWTQTLREKIKQRDDFECQECGDKCNILDVHHIDYSKDNHSHNNLITLCHGCHSKTNGNRKHWTKYFNKLIIQKYGDF